MNNIPTYDEAYREARIRLKEEYPFCEFNSYGSPITTIYNHKKISDKWNMIVDTLIKEEINKNGMKYEFHKVLTLI